MADFSISAFPSLHFVRPAGRAELVSGRSTLRTEWTATFFPRGLAPFCVQEMPRRHREKVAQMLENPRKWNGYVILACFDAADRRIRWSYHTQEEQEDAAS